MRPRVLGDVSNRRRYHLSRNKGKNVSPSLKRKHPNTKTIQKPKAPVVKEIRILPGKSSLDKESVKHDGCIDKEEGEIHGQEESLEEITKEWNAGMGKTWEESQAEEDAARRQVTQRRIEWITNMRFFPLVHLGTELDEDYDGRGTFDALSETIRAEELLPDDECDGVFQDKDFDPWWLPSLEGP